MKGRGVRVINDADFRQVTPDAETKTHFVIADAVGVTETELNEEQVKAARDQLVRDALEPLVARPELREKLLKVKASTEQVIDEISTDGLIEAGFTRDGSDRARPPVAISDCDRAVVHDSPTAHLTDLVRYGTTKARSHAVRSDRTGPAVTQDPAANRRRMSYRSGPAADSPVSRYRICLLFVIGFAG
jgi:type I restriction enzyme R subunit